MLLGTKEMIKYFENAGTFQITANSLVNLSGVRISLSQRHSFLRKNEHALRVTLAFFERERENNRRTNGEPKRPSLFTYLTASNYRALKHNIIKFGET